MSISRGRQYMTASVLFSFLGGLGVKLASNIPVLEIIFFKSLVTLIVSYCTLQYRSISIWGSHSKILVLRSVVGLLGLFCFFTSLQNMPLASAITIQYTSPILMAVLSIFIVKEYVMPWQWIFFLISFIGIVFIKGFDPNTSLFYVLVGLTASLCRGLSHNLVRRIHGKEHPFVIMFYATSISIVATGLYLCYNFVAPQPYEWVMLAVMGVCSCSSHYCMVCAYQQAPISKLASISYLPIVYAFVVSYCFLQETLTPMTLIGIVLVLGGVFLDLLCRERVKKRSNQITEEAS
ncbi:MAG: DMT family transporter [Bacteroidota bacterium]